MIATVIFYYNDNNISNINDIDNHNLRDNKHTLNNDKKAKLMFIMSFF